MTAQEVPEARWGAYRIKPRPGGLLREHEDGTLELVAEQQYVVELPPDAPEQTASQAFDSLEPGLGLLRFMNYIGKSEFGGRSLLVTSDRLRPDEVEEMLDDVVAGVQSLPFGFETPASFAYARDVLSGEDVTYQAYAFIRHALRRIGPHDLTAALNRIVARPNARLVPVVGDVPLARADRIDAATVMGIVRRPGPLHPVEPTSPLAGTPIAIALEQRVPERIESRRIVETTHTPENEFVVGVLEVALGVVERFGRAVVSKGGPRSALALQESQSVAAILERWRRHRTLADIPPARQLSIESTVLRSRPGYREVTRFFVDLQARTRLFDAADAERLLEARDAALIYEYWCYFQVMDAAASVLQREPRVDRFQFGSFGSFVPRSYAADFDKVRVSFNREFRRPQSYSVPLRPDITLELADGTLHLFDAKLKRDILPSERTSGLSADAEEVDIDDEEKRATYRRGDLYKMHTYRDALGARSVWILFPGRNVSRASFTPLPLRDVETDAGHETGPSGVGALPLLPGSRSNREELETLIREILA